MDIITHTLSGIAISTIVASLSKKEIWKKGVIIFCGAIGGALPDIDAISMWSRFDSTIGTFFHLAHKGRDIYFSNYWYSHHNFTHSLVGGLIITSCLLVLFSLPVMVCLKHHSRKNMFKRIGVYWIAVFLGYVMHLLGDLPTPSHTWGGIKLFWPIPTAIGGTGHIWWWNNYDIFVIIVGCCAINMGMIILYHLLKKPFIRYLPLFICIGSLIAILHQIDQRTVNFAYTGYTKRYDEYERKSLEIQQKILGEKLYDIMRNIDRKLTVYF
ncbi:MAG: metal-dependent hydrolase [Deltaproteobacteria bacterium]|nr:metal-dependent hydrolase [Deltaproteobacteria bacterium]